MYVNYIQFAVESMGYMIQQLSKSNRAAVAFKKFRRVLAMYCHILRMPDQLWSFYNNERTCLDMSLETADGIAKRCLEGLDDVIQGIVSKSKL